MKELLSLSPNTSSPRYVLSLHSWHPEIAFRSGPWGIWLRHFYTKKAKQFFFWVLLKIEFVWNDKRKVRVLDNMLNIREAQRK